MREIMTDNTITPINTDIVYTDTAEVSCQGNGVAAGHPLIYLNIGDNNTIECPYCSRKFIRNI